MSRSTTADMQGLRLSNDHKAHGAIVESSYSASDSGFDDKATKRLLRKIDFVLIPLLSALYLLSFLDRSNIGNARLAGLEQDLKMKGLDYNIALSIFFPFYVAADIPSNLMLKRSSPSIWIPTIMVAWGTLCCLMGVVRNYTGLLCIRAALGFAEGGLFPGVTFYITMWYRRHECGFRMAIFFSAATAAGAFGGLLARGIVELDGARGLSGWSWIFIIEGAVTLVFAALAFILMHDYPDTATFLTKTEKFEVQRRLEADRSFLADEFDIRYFWDAVMDWKIWVHMFIFIGICTPLYSFSLFLPTIVKSLGYTDNTAQLMTVPPYVFACLLCISGGYAADKHGQRGIYMIGFNLLAILGFILLIASTHPHIKYAGTFLAAGGIYPNIPQAVAWNGNNIGGSVKRSVGIAMQVGFGNLGGTVAGFLYQTKNAPTYYPGHGTLIALLVVTTVLIAAMRAWLGAENRRRDAEAGGRKVEELSEDERRAERSKGDDANFFRYTL
ncbi:MFS general substrate transporter [Lepidopterella palustris CBS 459.81]|uniref:MFS general substrate transporter n=1 Tax=Lepidopterella palustris CBS 459.81 TaxID=1314670 RepID=A0A8E2E387_9PEZI|nr:MFS general substrate transporter [Lepidopterella palustris CBS 459.81]